MFKHTGCGIVPVALWLFVEQWLWQWHVAEGEVPKPRNRKVVGSNAAECCRLLGFYLILSFHTVIFVSLNRSLVELHHWGFSLDRHGCFAVQLEVKQAQGMNRSHRINCCLLC